MLTPQQHPSSLLSDYVLDLLPPGEERQVERHLASCERCRAVVQRERDMARAVRHTLLRATQPAASRLRQLRPAPPPRRAIVAASTLRPLAALGLLLLLFLGALQINGPTTPGRMLVYPSQTSLAATATQTPTATQPADATQPHSGAADVEAPVRHPLPIPASTPLAAMTMARAGG